MLRFDVLLVFQRGGEGFVTGAALEGRELGRSMVLSSEYIRVVGPIVVPQARQLLKGMWQASGLKRSGKPEGSQDSGETSAPRQAYDLESHSFF